MIKLTWSSFGSIGEINIQGKKASSNLHFSNPTAQVWTMVDSGARRGFAQSLHPIQTRSSESTLSSRRKDSVEAIGERIEASRILFFCDASIITVLGETFNSQRCRRDSDSLSQSRIKHTSEKTVQILWLFIAKPRGAVSFQYLSRMEQRDTQREFLWLLGQAYVIDARLKARTSPLFKSPFQAQKVWNLPNFSKLNV
jgi:hypothetical protein